MSRARNRADGDFGDLDITNIGAVSLDSIKGDADANTEISFSGSDVITFTTGGTAAATFNASQILTLNDDLIIKSGGTIGGANDTDLLTLGNGTLTVAGEVVGTGFTGTLDGILGSGTAAAASVTTLTASGRIITDDATEATSTTDGSLQTDGGLSVVKDIIAGDDIKLLSDAAVLHFGADSDVILTHVPDTGLLLNSTMQLQFNDGSQFINAPSATTLDINATDEIELNATLVDVNANLDVSGTYTGAGLMTTGGSIVIPDGGDIGSASDTDAISIASDGKVTFTQDIILKDGVNIGSASDTNAIGISSGGVVSITATTANTSASDGALTVAGGLGVAADASVGDDLRLISDAAVLSFGADSDVTLTHVADTGLLLNGTSQLQFNDASQNITAPSATVLDINATDEIELNATLIDINGNVEISGTTTQTGISTSTAKDVFNAGLSVKNGSTSAGFVEFFEDSDNGTNKVTVIGPASTSDVTLTLPSSAGTIATTATAADEATALAIALG